MLDTQRLTILLECQQHIRITRFLHRDRPTEPECLAMALHGIQSGERDVPRVTEHAGRVEDVEQRNASPARGGRRLGAPRQFTGQRRYLQQFVAT